jgi:broad specificity phosphatase PhoE
MPHLILIRHSETKRVPGVNAHQWQLSEEGRRRCDALTAHVRADDLRVIVSSEEPKALQTAQPVADALAIPLRTGVGLHEHDRRNVPCVGDDANFQATIQRLFAEPSVLVYGNETADQAHERFAAAVQAVVAAHPVGNIAIVTHATVLTLFVSRIAGLDPFALWSRLGMPAVVRVALPEYRLVEVVEAV